MKKIILPIIFGILIVLVIFTLAIDIPIFLSSHDFKLPKNFSSIKLPRAYIVLSGSMEPAVKVGSVVISTPKYTYLPGDIVTFSLNNDKKNMVTHRIEFKQYPEGINGNPVYITSGDANKTFDQGVIKNENIYGKVTLNVPYLGYFANFAKTPYGFILLVIVPATIVIYEELKSLGIELLKGVKKIRKKGNVNQINLLKKDTKGLPKITIVIPVFGAFLVFVALTSSYFSDLEKSIGSMFQAASSFPETAVLENKKVFSTWDAILGDGIGGTLKYLPEGPVFDYEFEAKGLNPLINFCLIYYADPWASRGAGTDGSTGAYIAQGQPDGSGNLSLKGSIDIGTDLPNMKDANYPVGAKIWLVPCSSYEIGNHRMIPSWNVNEKDWLFEMRFIKYTRVIPSPTPTSTPTPTPTPTLGGGPPSPTTIHLNQLGGDVGDQYGYWLDYTNASSNNVSFSYQSPALSKLSGTIHGTGLKHYTTYQVKFTGIPSCIGSPGANDLANEYIGYKGRWTCASCGGTALSRNRTDTEYESNKLKPNGDPTKECIVGYLVWDFFNADGSGNANKAIESSNSYHVLRCGGGSCGTVNDTYLSYLDSSHSTTYFCPADKVNGELEPGRPGCGALTLSSGMYHLQMALTEESFHKGSWATVLYGNIDFEIQ
jgi:signal peptidase